MSRWYVAFGCSWAMLLATASGQIDKFDQQIDDAVARGVRFLESQISTSGDITCTHYRLADGGDEALVAWALAEAKVDPNRSRKFGSLLRRLQQKTPSRVFARASRILALAALDDSKKNTLIQKDGQWLLSQQTEGGWGVEKGATPNILDTAIAMLALRESQDRGLRIAPQSWGACEKFLLRCQNSDGGFGYYPTAAKPLRLRGMSHGTATAAGAIALGVLVDRRSLYDRTPRNLRAMRNAKMPPEFPRYGRAISWLSRNFNLLTVPNWQWGQAPKYRYWLLLSLATESISPMRLLGYDLDQRLPDLLMGLQKKEGYFLGKHVNESRLETTAYALLCLRWIRKPLLINKITMGTMSLIDYNDATHLTRWVKKTCKLDVAWRRLSPFDSLYKLRQAPILYLRVGPNPKPPADFAARLREYMENGGHILVQPLAGDKGLGKQARDFLAKLSEDYVTIPLGQNAKLLRQPQNATGLRVTAVGPSVRQSCYLLENDLSGAWHKGDQHKQPKPFALFQNLVLQITSRQALGPKFTLPEPVKTVVAAKPKHYLHVAGITLDGDKVLPQVFRHVSNDLAAAMSVGITYHPISLKHKKLSGNTIVWVTGQNNLNSKQLGNIKGYIQRGGVLLLDATNKKFADSARTVLAKWFGPTNIKTLSADHPLLTGQFAGGLGNDLRKVAYNQAEKRRSGMTTGLPSLTVAVQNGRIRAILSPLSLASSASGLNVHAPGYSTMDARRLVLNIILYSYAQQKNALK